MGTSLNPQDPSSQQTGASSTGLPGTTMPPAEYRVPMDDPRAWARGRTLNEVLGITEQLATTIQSGQQYQQQPAQPQYQNYQQPQYQQPAQPQTPEPDSYVQYRDVEQLGQRYVQQQVNPQIDRVANMSAQNSLFLDQQQHPKDYQRYGPEIMAMIGRLPPAERTVDNIAYCRRLVLTNHLEELARDRAAQLVADGTVGETATRSTGGAHLQSQPAVSSKIPQAFRDRLTAAGLTDAQIADFIQKQRITEDEYGKWAERTVITEHSRRGG